MKKLYAQMRGTKEYFQVRNINAMFVRDVDGNIYPMLRIFRVFATYKDLWELYC